MLFHVYNEPVREGYFIHEPVGMFRYILDADWIMWILLPMLLVIIVIVLIYAWRLHELPVHKAGRSQMRQAGLVSALTLMGLFAHWVWVVALFIAFMDWNAFEDALVRVLRRARLPAAETEPAQPAAEGAGTGTGAVESQP